jgi:DNA-binding transcriptional regulator YiaG
VPAWSAPHIRALRIALRMTVREFGPHVGVSSRIVSKWEAGGHGIRARSQASLDRALAAASVDDRRCFRALVAGAETTHAVGDIVHQAVGDAVSLVRHPDDARLMTLVPAGLAHHGPDDQPVWLAAYYIDVYPVTVADWDRFRAVTGHPSASYWGEQHDPIHLDHPVVGVNFADASAYATWAGRTLPTVHQWERAARGPHGWPYPWGTTSAGQHCNVRMAGREAGTTTPVTWYAGGASSYGVHDLLGNVWEWTRTVHGEGYAVRGGAFTTTLRTVDAFAQMTVRPDARRDDLGFRTVVAAGALAEVLFV